MSAVLVVYDTETTGLTPEAGDDIVQFAALIHRQGEDSVYEWQSLANPGRPIPVGASNVHGITDEMVAGQPSSQDVVKEWWREVLLFAEKDPIVLCGHNEGFDRRFITKHIEPARATGRIDTMQMVRRLHPDAPDHKLGVVYRHLGLSSVKACKEHDAMSDVWMAFELLRKMMADNDEEDFLNVSGWLEQPMVLAIMPYGKFKSQPMYRVEKKYAQFMLGKDLDPDVRASLEWVLEGVPG